MIAPVLANADRPMSEMVVRDACERRRDAILALTLAAYEQYAATLPEGWWPQYRQNIAGAFGAGAPGELIVADLAGTLLGSVLYYPVGSRDTPWPALRLLAVAPEARGHGTGRALMDECVRRARASGASTIGLHTMEVMAVARRLYERMGFVRVPEDDFHPVGGILVMGYRLDLDMGVGASV